MNTLLIKEGLTVWGPVTRQTDRLCSVGRRTSPTWRVDSLQLWICLLHGEQTAGGWWMTDASVYSWIDNSNLSLWFLFTSDLPTHFLFTAADWRQTLNLSTAGQKTATRRNNRLQTDDHATINLSTLMFSAAARTISSRVEAIKRGPRKQRQLNYICVNVVRDLINRSKDKMIQVSVEPLKGLNHDRFSVFSGV